VDRDALREANGVACDDLFVTYYGKNQLYHNNGRKLNGDIGDHARISLTMRASKTEVSFSFNPL
jgi:hypothetical protein